MVGACLQPSDVPAEEAGRRGARPLHFGEGQVGAQRHGPRDPADPPDVAQVCRVAAASMGEMAAQGGSLEGGDGHPLSVDRVERAHCVTEDRQAVREAGEPVVAVPDRRRVAVGDRLVEGLGILQYLVHVRQGEIGGEPREAFRVGRGVVTEDAHQGDQAAAVLDEGQSSASWPPGGGRGDGDEVVAQRVRTQPVVTARVADADPDPLLLRWRVAQRLQPDRQPRAAPGRVDNEVCGQLLLGASIGAADHPGANDPTIVATCDEADDVALRRATCTSGSATTLRRTAASRVGRLTHTAVSPEGP